jgi:serine/threonine protein kinase
MFTLEDGQSLQIGRGQESQTRLTDPRVSRKQCVLQVDGGKFVLFDSGSQSGTHVNGTRITQHELQAGDVVRIGGTELRLQLDLPEEASTVAAPAVSQPKPLPSIAPLKDLVGKSFQHFTIQKVLASGASGMVYLGTDTKENRPTAIKVLWPEASQREDELQRFVRAMKTMINVQHENIVQIYAAGKSGPYCWVAMEFVDGESLSHVIQRIGTAGKLDWRNAFRVAVQIGRALEKAFEHQIIHRNITPQNILLRHSDKAAKLGDLMLAKALEGTLAQQVTKRGQLVGELVYMPPERTRADAEVDCRSDIYGLGATCYALLTGRPPFEGDSVPEVVSKIRQAEPAKPKEFQMSIDGRFQDCVLKMLAKRPEDRYETPSKLLLDLERIGRYDNITV